MGNFFLDFYVLKPCFSISKMRLSLETTGFLCGRTSTAWGIFLAGDLRANMETPGGSVLDDEGAKELTCDFAPLARCSADCFAVNLDKFVLIWSNFFDASSVTSE